MTNKCELVADGHPITHSYSHNRSQITQNWQSSNNEVDRILGCVYVPQFKNLDTIHSSLPICYIKAAVTDGSGYTFGFSSFFPFYHHHLTLDA